MASSIPASVPVEALPADATRGGRVARRTRRLVACGVAFVVLLALVAVTAPWLAPHDPVRQSLRVRLGAPTPAAPHGRAPPFGTGHPGRGVLPPTLFGAAVFLLVGLAL